VNSFLGSAEAYHHGSCGPYEATVPAVPLGVVVVVAAGDVVEVADREYFVESWPYWEIERVRQLLVAAVGGVAAAVKHQVDVDPGEVLDSYEVGWWEWLLAVEAHAVQAVLEFRLTSGHQASVESDEDCQVASLQVGRHHWP